MNKIEEYKQEKDGLDILQDIPRYAAEGWEKITDGDKERLKWVGVFFRRQTPGRFMMRLRVPNGFMTAIQLRTIGEISGEFGKGFADITTRQQMQLRNRWTAEGSVVPVARRRRHNSGICHQFARTSARSRGSRHVGVLHRGIRLTHVQAPTSPEMDRWLVALLVLWKAEERSSQADRWAGGLHLQRVRRPLRRDPREGAAGKVMLMARPHGRDTVRWLIHLEQSSHLRLSEAWRCSPDSPLPDPPEHPLFGRVGRRPTSPGLAAQ